MEAKDKAKELVKKYYKMFKPLDYCVTKEILWKKLAKQCALICVDEIISTLIYDNNTHADWILDIHTVNYWQNVKTEINNL